MMNLHLLHGPGIISSRKQLINIKSQFSNNNVIWFDQASSSQQVFSALNTLSLISEPRLYIFENLPDSLSFENYQIEADDCLVFWYGKELDEKNKIHQFIKKNQGNINFFSESAEITIFPLLDYLGNKDKRAFLELTKVKKLNFDLQYIITMILYLLRNLATLPKGPEFIRRKISQQQKNFTPTQIKNLYQSVLEIDYKFKNGLLDSAEAEFQLINGFLV